MNAQHTKIQIMSLMTLTVILCALPSMSFAGAQWTYLTDLPTPRSVLSASVVNGKIYTMGGKIMPYRQTTSSSAVEEYDPMTNQWSQKADMPITRANFSTGVVDDKIYAIGGYTGQNGNTPPRSSVDVYDPATNTWSRITSMPIGEADHSSAAVDGKIYVIGGNTVQIYDPLTDTWTRGADRPSTPRWWAPVSVVNGKIYSIGGAKGPPTYRVVPTVEEYDPATDTWTAKTDIPIATASHASVVVDGRIYVINGNGVTGTVLSLVQVYDPATDTWIEGPRTSIARQLPCAGVVDGTIYLIGGFNPNIDRLVSYGAVEALDLNPFVDFNGDGAADLDDLLRLIESWNLDDPLVDIGPMPWGDGIVDSRDLFVLAEHMVEYDNLTSNLQGNFAMQLLAGKPGKETATYTVTFSGDLVGSGTRENMPVYDDRIEHMPLQEPLDLHAFFALQPQISQAEADICFPYPSKGIHGINPIRQHHPEMGIIITLFFDGNDHNGDALVYRLDLTGYIAPGSLSNWTPSPGTTSNVILTNWEVKSDTKGGRNKACKAEGTLSATVEVYRAL